MEQFKFGLWNVICDRCGFKRKSNQVMHTWDGLIVCSPSTGKTCYETRHPQDFVRTKPDDQSVPFTRPERDVFLDEVVNCSTHEPRWLSNVMAVDIVVYKGIVRTPLTIEDGVDVTIHCNLEIR